MKKIVRVVFIVFCLRFGGLIRLIWFISCYKNNDGIRIGG